MLFRAKAGLSRSVAVASRVSGRGGGTTLPGKLLLRMQPDAIGRLAARLPDGSALISATNGKTTTAKMAASILSPGKRLCRNGSGANLASGVASALLGADGAELGLFEVDEAALPGVARSLSPAAVVLGNLFRDQLDRYGELELVAARWREMAAELPRGSLLVCNGDDPLVASIGGERDNTGWFGIDDPAAGLGAMQHAADSKWCVRCGARLVYDAIYLGHLGAWRCAACGNARPALEVVARELRPEALTAISFLLCTPRGEERVRLPLPGLYNVYNALAASALALRLFGDLEPAALRDGLERFSAAFGRFERITLGDREAVLLLIKNPAGANEVIRTLAGDPAPKTMLLALNDRIADGRDVSWIWDVDFELLAPQVDRVVCTGTRAAEMGMRLKYAGAERIDVVVPAEAALDAVAARGQGTVYLLATYTAMLELRRLLEQRGLVRPFWEEAA